jgi:hypothetical protein
MVVPTISFPLGVAGAAEVSMPLLCAATSASAFALQEGNADYIHSAYQHLGVKPEHYGQALRQMAVAWSVSRWFAKPCDVLEAVRPTEGMIEESIKNLTAMAAREGCSVFHDSFATFFRGETYALAEKEGMRAGLEYLEYSALLSFRAGDVEASLSLMNDMWELLQNMSADLSVASHLKFAELWVRMGDFDRAGEHIAFVGDEYIDGGDHGSPRMYAVAVYRESGSFLRAALAAVAVTREKSVNRFLAHLSIAQEMLDRCTVEHAEAYIINVCFPAARRVQDAQIRVLQLWMLMDVLIGRGMEGVLKMVMDELIDPSANPESVEEGRRDGNFRW